MSYCSMKKSILIVSIGFTPNVGGVETHLDDLIKKFVNYQIQTTVLTYQPLETPVTASWREKRHFVTIYRLPMLRGYFYRFVSSPLLSFLLLCPLLFIATPFLLIRMPPMTSVYAQGLVAGLVSVFWGKVLHRKVYVGIHSIYHFPKAGLFRSVCKFIFLNSDGLLTLSSQSSNELIELGIPNSKITVFTYWVDQDHFKLLPDKVTLRRKFHLSPTARYFLFIGRYVKEKGILPLLEAAKQLPPDIYVIFAGTGPLQSLIDAYARSSHRVINLGKISQNDLPEILNAVDALVVPSIHDEGFGRVILEALSCGVPVVGSKRGGIPEAIDESVGVLIDVSISSLYEALSSHRYTDISRTMIRAYAVEHFSSENCSTIISALRL